MPPADLLWRALLTALLAAACASDLRARRIPNRLVLAVLALGLARGAFVWAAGAPAAPPLAAGPASALAGVAVGLAAWLPLYALGVLGAGDVKLFAAAAAWVGPHGVLPASTAAALAGGALGLAYFARNFVASRAAALPALAHAAGALGGPAGGAPGGRGETRVPYGLAIAAGVLAAAWGWAP
jgi:prepilin peptidase CpaA